MKSLENPRPGVGQGVETADRLDHVDYAWLRMDHPTNLMMINGVLLFDEPLAFEDVQAIVEDRLLRLPRFRHKVVMPEGRGKPRWELDPDFDLSAHVRRIELPAPGDDAALRQVVNELMSEPLDYGRPLWCFHLIENYRGGSAVMGRLHHCIGDGIALMLALLSLTDLPPEMVGGEAGLSDDEGESFPNPFTALFCRSRAGLEAARQAAERIMPDGMRLMLHPVEVLRNTRRWMVGAASAGALGRMTFRSADPKTVFKGPLGVDKRAAWSEPIPLEEVRALEKALGGTVNDLLLTAMTGGLRRYMLGRDQRPDGINFRAAVPVNLRTLEKMAELGNQFGLVFLALPVGIADPLERLAELRRRMRALKRSAEPLVVYKLLQMIGRAPKGVQNAVVSLFASKTTAVMTNVPGPQHTLYLAGKPMRSMFFWVPQAGRVGLGVSILSYAGHVRLGVGTDAGLVPDPEAVVEGFHAELEAMRSLAAGAG